MMTAHHTSAIKLAPLTSLRFLAAMLVVVQHGYGEFETLRTIFIGFPVNGGVSFFFVLSGFILAYAHPRLPSLSSAVDFWVKRFARIWPVHIAALIVLVISIGVGAPGGSFVTPAALASNLLLQQAWFNDTRYVFSFNSVAWSISVEAFFYAMFPLLIYRIEQTWPIKLALCAVIVVLVCLFYQDQFAMGLVAETRYPGWVLIQFNPPARLLEFMAGMTAYVLWRKYLQGVSMSRSTWTAIEVGVIAAVVIVWMQSRTVPVHLFGDFSNNWFRQAGAFIIPTTMIIVLMATSRGAFSLFLSWRPLVFLGEISFSLYMIHQIVLRWHQANRSIFAGYSSDAILMWYLASSLVAAILLWAIVENPCRRAILSAYRMAITVKTPQVTPAVSRQSA